MKKYGNYNNPTTTTNCSTHKKMQSMRTTLPNTQCMEENMRDMLPKTNPKNSLHKQRTKTQRNQSRPSQKFSIQPTTRTLKHNTNQPTPIRRIIPTNSKNNQSMANKNRRAKPIKMTIITRHKNCPKCKSKKIISSAKKFKKEIGCVCGFTTPLLFPYTCNDCKEIFENYCADSLNLEKETCQNKKCLMKK